MAFDNGFLMLWYILVFIIHVKLTNVGRNQEFYEPKMSHVYNKQ